jgi:lipoprotein-releasing system ATP-binding protein
MDEPTGNLDPKTAESVLKLLMELNEELKISFVVVTHDPHIARQLDRTISLVDGVLGQSLD